MVDGFISNTATPYEIKLSRTGRLDGRGAAAETGARVQVLSEKGETFEFEEEAPGVYRSDPAAFTGCIGQRYRLNIATRNDKRYASSEVTLKPSPPIDSVYFEREMRLTNLGDTLDGVKIMVDSHDPTGLSRRYRFTWTEDYEVRPLYPSFYKYIPSGTGYQLVRRDTAINLCFNSGTSTQVILANTSQLTTDRVSQLEVTYVSTSTPFKLGSLYSILVRQQVLSEAAYRYWSGVQKTTESLGTLFDPQPYQLIGNMYNPDDPDEPVLGYFDAGEVSEYRIFIRRLQLGELRWPHEPCIGELRSFTPREEGDVFKDEFNLFMLWGYLVVDGEGELWSVPECADCRLHGVLDRPDFWPDTP